MCEKVDTFKCPVESPGTWEDEWSWEYYVGKQQTSNYSLKYEVICSVGVPQIIWCAGPFKGAAHDKTISELDGICDQLKEGEAICADKAYWGDRETFVSPFSGNPDEMNDEMKSHNYLVYAFHQTIERVIMRMRTFGLTRVTWRLSINLHELAMKVVCKLINLFLIFEPLG